MQLTTLGSGTYQPELKRHASSHLITIGKKHLLFDFGRGALEQLLKKGIRYSDVDAIFITHMHPDHASEIPSFLHIALAEPEGGKLRKKDITIYGPPGFKAAMKHLFLAFGLGKHEPKFKVRIKELRDREAIKGAGYRVRAFKEEHGDNQAVGYRLEGGDKVFAYSGDVGSEKGILEAAKGADLLLIEASWPIERKPKSHLTGGAAAQIAKKAGAKKLVLTHMAPEYLKNYSPKKEAERFFEGPVFLAQDLLEIKF